MNIIIILGFDENLIRFSCFCCCLLIGFKINIFEKFFQEYHQSVKQFGSRLGPTFFQA